MEQVVREDEGAPDITDSNSMYQSYKPQLASGKPHPSPLLTTTTLAYAAESVKIDPLAIHPSLRTNEGLSAAQLDAIALARDRHLRNKGFLLGDATGVGKGRTLAGVIYNHVLMHPECEKMVFVTASADLLHDLKRDLDAVGFPLKGKRGLPLFSVTETTANADVPIPYRKGIAFMTYATLRSNASKSKNSRAEQLIKWCAGKHPERFQGVLAFDEVHFAKDGNSETSRVVVDLQNSLRNASVVYASATAMSNVTHLCALIRLGLWDTEATPGATAYPNFEAFSKRWRSASRSTLEILAAELVSSGAFIARRLSFEGTKFDVATANFTDEQAALHRKLCEWWLSLWGLSKLWTGKENASLFWGAHLRFFKALLIAFRVRFCALEAKKALDAGGSVVVSLIGTGEAAAKRSLAAAAERANSAAAVDVNDGGDGADGADSGGLGDDGFVALKETLLGVLSHAENNACALAREAVHATDAVASQKLLKDLREQVTGFQLPPTPLDLLIDEMSRLGYGDVAEMTGRSGGFFRELAAEADSGGATDTTKWEYRTRTMKNVAACNLFQKGKRRIAIISTAASCGISLHDTKEHPISRPRTMILLELPWQANQSFQTTGRVQRSYEHSSPTYCLVTSNLDAEGRFASTVAKRAADLGAGTTGDRRGAVGNTAFGSDVLVGTDAPGGLRRMIFAVGAATRSEKWPSWCSRITDKSWPEVATVIRKTLSMLNLCELSKPKQLLGRLLGMPIEFSNLVFHVYFQACVQTAMDNAKKQNDMGVADFTIGGNDGTTSVAFVSEGGCITLKTDVGVSFDAALKKAEAWQEERKSAQSAGAKTAKTVPTAAGWKFFVRYDTIRNREYPLLGLLDNPRVQGIRPNGRTVTYLYDDFKRFGYAPVEDLDKMREIWQRDFDRSLTVCVHGPTCKDFGCTVGKRHIFSTLLTLPGAFSALRDQVGARQQVVRIDGSLSKPSTTPTNASDAPDAAETTEADRPRAVALRLAMSHALKLDLIEERLHEQKVRDDMELSLYTRRKQAVLDDLDRKVQPSSNLPTGGDKKRSLAEILMSSDDDSDDDDSESSDGERDTRGPDVFGADAVAPKPKIRNRVVAQPQKKKKTTVDIVSSSEDSDSSGSDSDDDVDDDADDTDNDADGVVGSSSGDDSD